MSSSILRCSRMEAIGDMPRKSCPRRGRGAGSERRGEERDERELALLSMLMACSVRRESAFIVGVGVFFWKGDVIGACAGEGWEKKETGSQLLWLGAGREAVDGFSVRGKTCGGAETMRAASLMTLNERKSSGDKGTVWRAAVRHVSK